MPQPYSSPPAGKRSASAPPSPAKDRSSGIFTALPPDSSPPEADSPGNPALSESDQLFPSDGSLDATEPFPDGLFRVPLPDEVFGEMPRMSDSALRTHLALIRLSFRFDPEESTWVKPERTFTRADVQRQSGLSSQGVRNGLHELAETGCVQVDDSGRSYEYALEMRVPEARYTYVPTELLEAASGLSGTELRLVLAVIRGTWGWTFPADESEEQPSHRRWARLSTSELARRTGRSETALKAAVSELQGRYVERLRPTGGAYYYRFLPEAVTPEPEEEPAQEPFDASSDPRGQVEVRKKREARVSMGTSNDLTPDLQRSDPPVFYRESFFERSAKQRSQSGAADRGGQKSPTTTRGSAVLENQKNPGDGELEEFITGFSKDKRELGQKLANVGVWPRRIPELLRTFSAERVEKNFEYYRQEARKREISNPGGWVNDAITEGYATFSGKEDGPASSEGQSQNGNGNLSVPTPGTKVSETRKRVLIRSGKAEDTDFKRFKRFDNPDRKQHFYRLE